MHTYYLGANRNIDGAKEHQADAAHESGKALLTPLALSITNKRGLVLHGIAV